MNSILNVGKSGLNALQKRIDNISNNIANMNTKGYKRLDQDFQELLRYRLEELGTPLTEELEAKDPTIGSGVKVSEVYRKFEQGSLASSSNPLELAIEGNGFFGIQNENGSLMYSRVGDFSIGEEGDLIDRNGNKLMVEDLEDLTEYDSESIIINNEGKIFALDDGETEEVGQIVLYDVENKNMLEDIGGGYYKIKDGVEIIESTDRNSTNYFGKIRQGFYEASNVDMGEEMINLMILERAYQLNARSLEAADEMWQQANNLRR